jgi:hypothetical protein
VGISAPIAKFGTGGFDAPKEIRRLGKGRICQMNLKDKGYLEDGKVNFPEVLRAIKEIDFRVAPNLATSSPSGSVEGDVRSNLAHLRGIYTSARLGSQASRTAGVPAISYAKRAGFY